MAWISFATPATYLWIILMYVETAIAKYTPTSFILIGVVGVLRVVLGVLGISERIGGVVVE